MGKVVITGLGAVTALGENLAIVWNRLVGGANGISRIRSFDASQYNCKVAAEVRQVDGESAREWDNYGGETGLDSIPGEYCRRGARLFLKAATEAYEDSGLALGGADPARIGVAAGGSVAYFDMDVAAQFFRLRRGDGRELDLQRFVSEGSLPKHNFFRRIGDLMAVLPAKKLGLAGPVMVVDTACAASGHAIGQAFRMVQQGRAKAMLAGGAAALVGPLPLLYFTVLGALSRNPDPELACRPFDRERDGFVMGEGGAAVVLEDEEHARARGARIYAELAGYGSSMNAHNLTDPSPDGCEEARAMRLALQDASLPAEHVGYIAAHGTSTPKNDASETLAIKKVFGEHCRRLMVSSSKGQIGHTLSGAAACNLVFAVKAVETGCVPPTMHYAHADPDCDLDYVPNRSREARLKGALANSFAFGGQNAVLAVRAFA